MDNKTDKDNYKSPVYRFYFNRKDKRIFVPKLVGVGLTLNFGHWAAWLIIIALVVLPLAFMYWLNHFAGLN